MQVRAPRALIFEQNPERIERIIDTAPIPVAWWYATTEQFWWDPRTNPSGKWTDGGTFPQP